jgi:alkylhydroperoxidase family enzyme
VHGAVALAGMNDAALVEAVLSNWRTAPVGERMRAVLGLLETLTLRPDEVSADDILRARQAGASDAALEQAIVICALFNIADRLADVFDYESPDAEGARKAGEMLLLRGYK